jgi:hypothetical protein
VEHDQYCRDVEAHLCRRNDGHLIRLVGPSFELVRAWAERGVPLKIVMHGIDRYTERRQAKRPRRRPVRIDFCEADVLDAFDEWRRAVGSSGLLVAAGDGPGARERAKPRHSLAAHVDRVVGRLAARPSDPAMPALGAAIAASLDRLDRVRDGAARARGTARAALVEELAAIDRTIVAAARAENPAALREQLAEEAAADLRPFRDRMVAGAYEQALATAADRLLRERLSLPTVAYE